VAIRVASAAAVATAPSSPVGPMVGASAVAASTSRIAVRDNLPVTTSVVATLRGSTSYCPSMVGVSR
jgi:hypothetical protein